MLVRTFLATFALVALTTSCTVTAPSPEPAPDEPTAPSAAAERRRIRMQALASAPVAVAEPGPPPRIEPFTAVVAGWCIVVDPPVEFAPDQVFRVTQSDRPGFRAKLQPVRANRIVVRGEGGESRGTEQVATPQRLRLIAFPQDVDGDPGLVDGETIALTPLVQIPGCEVAPWPAGVSDVMPPPPRSPR